MFKFQAPETNNTRSTELHRKIDHKELTLESVQELKTTNYMNSNTNGNVSMDNEVHHPIQVIKNLTYALLLHNDHIGYHAYCITN